MRFIAFSSRYPQDKNYWHKDSRRRKHTEISELPAHCSSRCRSHRHNNLTGTRALSSTYQNTSGQTIFLTGSASTNGSGTGTIKCSAGPSFPAITLFENEATATMNYGRAAFACMIPDTYYYQISSSGAVGWPPASPIHEWIETMLPF